MVKEFLKKRTVDDIWSSFDRDVSGPKHLMFGVKEIDQALNGGLLLGKVCEIYGPSGSGKTQFALSLTSEVLINNLIHSKDYVVLYIYTNGTFPIERLNEILRSKYEDAKGLIKADENFNTSQLLKNLYVEKVTDNDELYFTFTSKLEEMLQHNVKLIVIDSIAALFRTVQNESYHGQRINSITKVGLIMKRISHEYNLLILAINQASGVFNLSNIPFLNPRSGIKPALGEAWERCINSRILVTRRRDQRFNREIRHFQVIFSSNSPSTYPIPFITTKRGIEYNLLL
ncbi:Rad51 family protein [Theileria parva strain Muguga]|uniref:RecA family profile 1 domain-containing protein n=1 Tax=Theileria parva TaxID=5875 RepID=Q4N299_THEPA|nr:Rad51 family protein [Theileria parva strain Muguga]EAN31805.1 Rad51 family protein [Theileria parva strain Muguga]|eukprot:XP_764088.1 hypothetical protein [Theileria parva strain Muguga]